LIFWFDQRQSIAMVSLKQERSYVPSRNIAVVESKGWIVNRNRGSFDPGS